MTRRLCRERERERIHSEVSCEVRPVPRLLTVSVIVVSLSLRGFLIICYVIPAQRQYDNETVVNELRNRSVANVYFHVHA